MKRSNTARYLRNGLFIVLGFAICYLLMMGFIILRWNRFARPFELKQDDHQALSDILQPIPWTALVRRGLSDTLLWGTFAPKAQIDADCNALPECVQGPGWKVRPLIVSAANDESTAVYMIVVGLDVETPHGHGRLPQLTYYIGDRDGTLWRLRPADAEWMVRLQPGSEWTMQASSLNSFFSPGVSYVSLDILEDFRGAFTQRWMYTEIL